MSRDQELKLKVYSGIPCLFQWVMMSSASSALTIGEMNQKMNVCRCALWIPFVCVPPFFIAATACAASIPFNRSYNRSFQDGFPWWLPVVMLGSFYQAVVTLVMGHLTLFLPEAPFAAWEALYNVGYKQVGIVVVFTSGFSLLLGEHPWVLITWACLLVALIAAVLVFWDCLVRTYGKQVATGAK